ncbi:TlpA disulfide reductase family protein [Arenibacter certesii]|uniref:Thiol:disulfide interchange protein n=1 Tax=Arenibacter certesii TaxID=228955 RepID=A0A918ISV1_9FLAO|nr:TlpA disulfide reductase family protein [Arenibacter certesii]GGW26192.1 thiol:disulfide interchange protein [Arenibacter certesii]
MKKLFLSLSVIVGLVACNNKPEGYVLNGSLSGDVEDGTQVFIRKINENNQPFDIDTTTVQNGKFSVAGTAESPDLIYVFVDNVQGYTPLVADNGTIELTAHKDSLNFAKVKGTVQNDIFFKYLDNSRSLSDKAMSIQQDLQEASMAGNEATIKSLQDEFGELQEEYKNFELQFIKDNPNGLISALLIDKALNGRIIESAEAQEMYDALTPEIKETVPGKQIATSLTAAKAREEKGKSTSIGAVAPDFSGPTPDGGEISLKEAMGKVTIIDFWAAWCKPCRVENPNVVRVYNKYHEKGLNIIGVSLDRKEEDWKKAIADDNLTWSHISSLDYFDDAIAKLYNVDAIPATFILDENGVIIAKNLRGPALEEKISELLN